MPFLGPLWMIFAVSFVIECFSLLWTPARDASLPNLVPRRQLANANSLGLITTYATLPLGALVFTFLSGGSGLFPYFQDNPAFLALWLDAFTFGLSALLVSRIQIPRPAPTSFARLDLSRVGKDIADGVRFLRENSLASSMTLGIVAAFSAVGAVLALGTDLRQDGARCGRSGLGDPRDVVRHRDGDRDGVLEQDRGVRPARVRVRVVDHRGRGDAARARRRCPRSGRRR